MRKVYRKREGGGEGIQKAGVGVGWWRWGMLRRGTKKGGRHPRCRIYLRIVLGGEGVSAHAGIRAYSFLACLSR